MNRETFKAWNAKFHAEQQALNPTKAGSSRPTGRQLFEQDASMIMSDDVFIKKMEFVRDYEIRDGVAYLKRMESHTDTRIVGRADLSIEYANVRKQVTEVDEAVEEARAASNR